MSTFCLIFLISSFIISNSLFFCSNSDFSACSSAISTFCLSDSSKINSGIAFSLLDFNNAFTSYGLSIIGVLLVIYLHAMLRNETSKANQFALTLILSGALGNILDRVIDGVVTDFLYFHIGDQSFFIFNFADAFITIGAAIFFISELKNYFGSSSA